MSWVNERVALVYGGVGSEASVSREGKEIVAAAMRSIGIKPIEIDIKDGLIEPLMAADPTRVFNLVHGQYGEDGVLQGLLCALGIPFTGSGVGASALALDKPRTKQVWESLGLPTAPMVVVNDVEQAEICVKRLGPELFVKPAHEGSSVGAHVVHGGHQLKAALIDALKYDTRVLVEPLLPGPEFTVGIVRGLALPVIGIRPSAEFYDYNAKYQTDDTDYQIPSGLSPELEAEAQQLALEAFDALGCRTWGRIDFMMDETGHLLLIECNTVPGMGNHSLVPKAAQASGMDMPMLIEQILLDTEVSP
jgi:D-alanine-D-alanine ligase